MIFRKKPPKYSDRVSSEALAAFGRYSFLGPAQSGVTDSFALISDLVPLSYPPDGPGYSEVVAELRRHAQHGEWERVGAWKYVREFLSDGPDVQDLIDGGLMAIFRMRVTNLAIHLAPIDTPRYVELTGAQLPNDGFFGPPVFDSSFGPTRQYYFDHAIATAAGRIVKRLQSAPGIEPGPLDDAVRSMWDFGLLVYRGPLVVSTDISYEPTVVARAVSAATGVDHDLFADRMANAALDTTSFLYGPWTSIGGARFVEEYLDPSTVDSPGYQRLLDNGLVQLADLGLIGVAFTPELLTVRQRQRLAELRPSVT